MKNLFKYILLMTSALMMIACYDHNFDFESHYEHPYVRAQKEAYNESFAENFGVYGQLFIDEKHTWGFDSLGYYVPPVESVTRGSNPNSNQWADFIEVPPAITTEEANYVYQFFKKYSKNAISLSVNWSEFFVQHVWKGIEEYTNGDGQTVVGSEHMDHLYCADEHAFNFNNSNGSIMLMQNSSTAYFSYDNSEDSKKHYEYIIMYVPGYGYYVGFDFYANGATGNMQVERDGVYTDWIVKICPGVYKTSKRIMCEDLGTTDDFDFNDVVFDVAYDMVWWDEDSKNIGLWGIITLQAAGGTLPLYIYDTDEEHEVHNLFGVGGQVMTNTNCGTSRPPVIFRVKIKDNSTNPNDIDVTVISTKAKYILDAEEGKIPRKICVPNTVDWTDERVNIKDKYPKFSQWISNQDFPFWE